MFALERFTLSDLVQCSAELRRVGADATSMEQVAQRAVTYLRDHLVEKESGEPACALVRFYKTHRYEDLPPELQTCARAAADDARVWAGVNCLTLLGTAGDLPEWNDRRQSARHRTIPLYSTRALEQLPMVHRLVTQLGLDPVEVVEPDPSLFVDLDQRSFDVFHIADAVESPHVPAQESFVLPFGVRSVLGMGAVLPSGSLVAVILFSRVPVSADMAELFRSMAVSVKLAVLPFAYGPVFDGENGSGDGKAAPGAVVGRLRSENTGLRQLLEVSEETTFRQALRLEGALEEAERRAGELAASRLTLAAAEARSRAVVASALDAIVTIDEHGKVLEFNPAAAQTFGYEQDEVIGHTMAELIIPTSLRARHYRGFNEYLRSGTGPLLGKRVEVTGMRADGEEFPVELTVIAVENHDPPVFTGFLRDITERKAAERALLESRDHVRRIARTLQDSLLPPGLPSIPHMEMAAWYHPAGNGSEVGGDFYDVFQTGRDHWSVVLGDVCGKGAEAAALTALARYTVRAAAMRSRKPSGVLGVLNQALIAQQPDRFCTVVLGLLRVGQGRCRLTVASGGHPLALVGDPSGEVRKLGGKGMLIGQFPGVHFAEETVDLLPGQVVVLYTDGVTEGRGPSGLFGEDRLVEVIRGATGGTALQLVRRIEDAVLDFQGGEASDDIAVLILKMAAGGTLRWAS